MSCEKILSSDDSVYCEDPSHRALQIVSLLVIAVVAVGLPLAFGFILLRASRRYERNITGKHKETAKRIAKVHLIVTPPKYLASTVLRSTHLQKLMFSLLRPSVWPQQSDVEELIPKFQ